MSLTASMDQPDLRARVVFPHCRRCFAVIGAAMLLGTGCAADSGDPAMAQGQSLYEANCASCHGESALGDGSLAGTLPVAPPSLLEHLGHHTESQLIQIIKNGVPPAMPPTPLPDEEIALIVDHVWTLVPESEVGALREMQQHMEMMGDSAVSSMPDSSAVEAAPGSSTPGPTTHMQHGAGAASAGR